MKRFALFALSLLLPAGLTAGSELINRDKELIIRTAGVVEHSAQAKAGSYGAFTLEHLLGGISRDGTAKTALLDWMNAWVGEDEHGKAVAVGRRLIARWKGDDGVCAETPDGKWTPDFSHAPFRLLAVINRLDLLSLDVDGVPRHAGEGRFVFGLTKGPAAAGARALQATVIFEFELPAQTDAAVLDWAQAWHALAGFTQFDAAYCTALAELTVRFTRRGVRPGRPNASALNQIRTNEAALSCAVPEDDVRDDNLWILQEFRLDPATGGIVGVTTKQTPAQFFANTQRLADYVNTHEDDILRHLHAVPATYQGALFLGTLVKNDSKNVQWDPRNPQHHSLIKNPQARFYFALNTCNGCHGAESPTHFTHIRVREADGESLLSDYLDGVAPKDPLTPPNDFPTEDGLNEIPRRQEIMAGILSGLLLQKSAFISRGYEEKVWDTQKFERNRQELLRLIAIGANRVH